MQIGSDSHQRGIGFTVEARDESIKLSVYGC